jgi:hypothetical protein
MLKSPLFNYFETLKAYGKSILDIKYMFPFFLQLLFMIFFSSIFMAFVMHTDRHVGFHLKCLLFSNLRKLDIFWKILLKLTGIKFN